MTTDFLRLLGCLLALELLLPGCASVASNEFEVAFSARDIKAVLNQAPMPKTLHDGLITVYLEAMPSITLGNPPNRVGVSAQLSIQIAGSKPLPVKINGSTSIVYSESKKAFFFQAAEVNAVDFPLLPKALEGTAKSLMSSHLSKTLSANPIYSLPEDGSVKERAARRWLKSIQIRDDAVVAKFALQ